MISGDNISQFECIILSLFFKHLYKHEKQNKNSPKYKKDL